MFPCYSLLDVNVILFYDLPLINPCKPMSGYFYFPDDLKDIKKHI